MFDDQTDLPLTRNDRNRLALFLCVVLVGLSVLGAGNAGCGGNQDIMRAVAKASPSAASPSAASPSPSAASPRDVQIWQSLLPESAKVMHKQLYIIQAMSDDYGVNVNVSWALCGSENSFYQFSNNTITLCLEMTDYPGAAMQFAAHEMGHAVLWNKTSTSAETDADEIAALALADHGFLTEMLDASIYMLEKWPYWHQPGDIHAGGKFRAWELACVETGAEMDGNPGLGVAGGSHDCLDLYRGLRFKWAQMFAQPQFMLMI